MISGHFATTLIAKRHSPKAPWWLLIVGANGLDFLMYTLVLFGIERLDNDFAGPPPHMPNAIIDMTFSHDLLPILAWSVLATGTVWLITRQRRLALVFGALFVGHWLCDLVVGYGHFVCGSTSTPIGTDMYVQNFGAAVALEVVFSVVCVAIATVGTDVPVKRRILLFAGFGLAPLLTLLA